MKRLLTFLLFIPVFAGAQTRYFPGKSVFQGHIVIDSLKGATGLATDATGKIIAGTGGVTPIAFQDSLSALNARLATKAALADTANALRTLVFSANDFVRVAAFGAIPNDPTKGAVNVAAFAAALATGKRVYVPTGTWTLASDLTLTGSQMIFGDGAGSVIATTNLSVSGNATVTNCTANYLSVSGNATVTNCTANNYLYVSGNATATNCAANNNLYVFDNATVTNCAANNYLYVYGNATATNCAANNNLDVRGNARLFGGSVLGNTAVSNTTNARLIGVRFSSANVYLNNNTGLQRIGCIDDVAPTFTGPQGSTGWANIGGANYTAGTGIEISGNSISVAAAKVTAWDGAVTKSNANETALTGKANQQALVDSMSASRTRGNALRQALIDTAARLNSAINTNTAAIAASGTGFVNGSYSYGGVGLLANASKLSITGGLDVSGTANIASAINFTNPTTAAAVISFNPGGGAQTGYIKTYPTGNVNFYGNTVNYGGGATALASTTGALTITSAANQDVSVTAGKNVLLKPSQSVFVDIPATRAFYVRNVDSSTTLLSIIPSKTQVVIGAQSSPAPSTSRLVAETGDIETRQVGAGIIVNDAANNGKRWRISVNNGTITATQL